MSTKSLQVVPSSDPAAPSLSAEIAQAFEHIRERAYQLYEEREASHSSGDAAEDWLRAERQLFDVPAVELVEEPGLWRLSLAVDRKSLRALVAEDTLTVIGDGGAKPVFCHLSVPGISDASAEGARLLRRGESLVEIALPKLGPAAEEAARSGKRKARTASSAA